MSFEDSFLRKIDKKRAEETRVHRESLHTRLELPAVIKQAHERAKKEIFTNKDYSVQAPEFVHVYGADAIKRDMHEVLELRKKFDAENTAVEKNSHTMAEVLEAVVLMHSELSNWLGDARTFKTSIYDDYKNKTDMYAEWFSPQEGSRILAMGVDVTFSRMGIQKKLSQIKSEIDRGEMGKIRYFKDARGDFLGTRNNVPRVIVGVHPGAVQELAELWMKNDNVSLAKHPIQHVLIDEIYEQVTRMREYADKKGKKEPVRAYTQTIDILQKLKSEKAPIELGRYADDPVAKQLHRDCQTIFG